MTRHGPRRRVLFRACTGLTLVLSLTACVGGRVDTDVRSDEVFGPDDTLFQFAHVYDAQHPVETCGVPTIQESLSGSGVNIESYPAAQLGSEAETLEQIALGGLDLAVAGPSFLGVWHEPAALLDSAYLLEDVDHFLAAVESPEVTDIHQGMYEETGIRELSTWYYGTRHLTSDAAVRTPEDLDGLKVRTPDAPLYLTNIAAMGGTATPMALDELYMALQQGTLDAQENPVPTIESSKLHEVQRYVNLTGHIVQAVHVVTHDGVYATLDDDQRVRFDAAMEHGADAVRACIVEQETEALERWEQDGSITVNRDVDREAFADRVRERLPDQVPWGELYLTIQEGT
ncbi:TRAP transporter substrate-binding protein DctP [Nocardiopsis sp. MG754419]|uniref:TRAP transporter substrate-binding protein DctP n=1 Tax=Nocardiopsis sp. MG754419 TaxID=2259865 RepID=UPI001BA61EF8|nr:TRAP transporter substrate-binding protein DctP [Nocardiopsis sp. MG754419]MBR8741809.1 TRAP transporter substrate-binding protein DctP [Nocardiopsis sp. MG754419]